jgi:hypothetical protein
MPPKAVTSPHKGRVEQNTMNILTNRGFQINTLPQGMFLSDLTHTPLFTFVCYRRKNPTLIRRHCDGCSSHLEMGITSTYIKELGQCLT